MNIMYTNRHVMLVDHESHPIPVVDLKDAIDAQRVLKVCTMNGIIEIPLETAMIWYNKAIEYDRANTKRRRRG